MVNGNIKFYQNKYPVKGTAKYVVDYVYNNNGASNYYYQLVRLADNLILYANADRNNVCIYAWKTGIKFDEVSFI